MKITEKIREIRTQKNLSQEYLASYLGIDTSSYHRLERGVCPLTIQRLERIAEAFSMSVPELLYEDSHSISNTKSLENYIHHLEEEIQFLRAQLQENNTLSKTALPSSRTSPFHTESMHRIRG